MHYYAIIDILLENGIKATMLLSVAITSGNKLSVYTLLFAMVF